MTKATTSYWNPLHGENAPAWEPVPGLEGMAEQLTLSIDEMTGEYTRLTRFLPGADTTEGCVVLEMSFPSRARDPAA